MVAHPSSNNKVVGSNPRSSIFLHGQAGAPQLHFFVAKSGYLGAVGRGLGAARLGLGAADWGQVQPVGPGLGAVATNPCRLGLADRGQGVAGRGRTQPLPPDFIFYIFSIFRCIYNMAMCCFLSF
jgi:hypothetical protein